MEYIVGFEFIREPEAILPEGSVVETHTHNAHHNTHLTMGLWDVYRYQPIVGDDGVQLTHKVEKTFTYKDAEGVEHSVTEMQDEGMWNEMPVLRVQGGGPRTVIPIPAKMKHKFVLVKGDGFYRCVFAHRDADGNICEVPQHYNHWIC